MTYCTALTAVNRDELGGTAISLRCRSWGCEECGPKRKAQLIACAMAGTPDKMLTLTIRKQDDLSPEDAARRLSHAWRLLRLRLMRKYRMRKLPFLLVVEKHKSGYPHFHILMRTRYLDQKYISSVMQELIGSPIVHIFKITSKEMAAGYAIKYCGKAAQKFETTKRYWQSRDYDLSTKPDYMEDPVYKEHWEICLTDFPKFLRQLDDLEYVICVKTSHVVDFWEDPHAWKRR